MVGPHLKAQPGTLVSSDLFNRVVDELMAMQRLVTGAFIEGGFTPGGLQIGVQAQALRAWLGLAEPAEQIVMFFAWLGGGTECGKGTNRWTYSFWEVEQVAPGYGASAWRNVENGHSGTAYNGCEVSNAPTGVQGTGVDTDNLSAVAPGMEHQPIPPGVVVPMFGKRRGDSWDYWFAVPNGIDGTCS